MTHGDPPDEPQRWLAGRARPAAEGVAGVGQHLIGRGRVLFGTLRPALVLSALVGLALLTILPLAGTPAYAAPGDPFDPAVPTVFISQGIPTQLSRALASTGGAVSFVPEGGPAPVTYNGIGYRTVDNFI